MLFVACQVEVEERAELDGVPLSCLECEINGRSIVIVGGTGDGRCFLERRARGGGGDGGVFCEQAQGEEGRVRGVHYDDLEMERAVGLGDEAVIYMVIERRRRV